MLPQAREYRAAMDELPQVDSRRALYERAILDLLKQINRELGLTIVMITHQMEVIKQVCDRVAVLEAGQVVESGRVIDVFLRPQHEVTRAATGVATGRNAPPSPSHGT